MVDNENAFVEVFQFLGHPTLRPTAVDLLLGMSTSDALVEAIKSNLQVVGSLCDFASQPELKLLVNVSRDETVAGEILKRIDDISAMLDADTEHALMLLCNLAKVDVCRSALVPHLPGLASRLPNVHAQYIMIELSRTGHLDILRHIDATGKDDFTFAVLKNLLLHLDNHPAILEAVDFASLGKASATSPSVVELEFLLLAGTTLPGRVKLRDCNVYDVLKEAHVRSEDDEYRELVERVVELIVRDEEK